MLSYKEIEVPDQDEFRNVSVVEILVKEGERIEVDTPLISVQSSKGTADLPSPLAGKVQEVIVQIDDRISKGTSVLLLETEVDDPTDTDSSTEIRDVADEMDRVSAYVDDDPVEVLDFRDPEIVPDEPVEPEALRGDAAEIEAASDESPDTEPLQEEPPVEDTWDRPPPGEEPSIKEPEVRMELPGSDTNSDTKPGYRITVPDIGDFEEVEVIEVHVSAGDQIGMEDSLITLESDKATMDVPSPVSGTIEEVLVEVGAKVSEGTAIATLNPANDELGINGEIEETEEVAEGSEPVIPDQPIPSYEPEAVAADEDRGPPPVTPVIAEGVDDFVPDDIVISVPDIGDFDDVEVIEVHVEAGQSVKMEDPLITLESDKATMDVPSPMQGIIREVFVATGDRVSEGSSIASLGVDSDETARAPAPTIEAQPAGPEPRAVESASPAPPAGGMTAEPVPPPSLPPTVEQSDGSKPHASPGVRRFARELGVDLSLVAGSGPKGRIVKTDVQQWVKKTLAEPRPAAPAAPSGGSGIPEIPEIDFSQFGEIESRPLSRIKKLTATNLSRAWLNVPHVTQHDEADITELEQFRQELKNEATAKGEARITMLSFLMKACVVALKAFPDFNSSLEKGGANLILKKYYHLGIAVDTEEGLVVPVVKDVDRKTIRDLAAELGGISDRAREKKLSPKDLQGASFTISSLGGIGGSAFTPIVNAPEVAILGVSRSSMKPVYQDGEFAPRLILPLSLSYDHRVIDGAQAARFTTFLAKVLEDVRRLLL